jgi:hypothetical protein
MKLTIYTKFWVQTESTDRWAAITFINAAASSSAVPPISPIRMIPEMHNAIIVHMRILFVQYLLQFFLEHLLISTEIKEKQSNSMKKIKRSEENIY